jgi:hypothetical protein
MKISRKRPRLSALSNNDARYKCFVARGSLQIISIWSMFKYPRDRVELLKETTPFPDQESSLETTSISLCRLDNE